ncbi:DNA-binding transcriptional LysR family regulator [Herbaspirillum sp. Sphag1AN]|uniref:LysR family transcriptional regulator n=1 Tax=unclassified Herbaspirillum TaxID=2624150 RepID=UPI00160E7151|nr:MULTISPECIES: LysR family transcriptional regulator [unclassified Herbaspirillum]MBB3213399.1 DNA-binding transcriptional LysR family regulator [Herbaspirillum sp. Sphag1AN]MBB3246557.1 DNA-binding transcriptional LysR family regulator [Herbaspirillum sp. Sphag64]
MRYSLDQLEVFVLVTQTGGFSAAARKLGKTQSTISSAIANLEADWGVQLFDRSSKLAVLTAAGQALLIQAKEILERCKVLEGQVSSLNLGVETALTLSIELPYSVVVAPLNEFAQRFEHVSVHIRPPHEGNFSTLVHEGLATLGMGFAQANYPDDLAFTQLGRLVLTHVVCKEHPLASLGKVRFSDLHVHRRLAFSAHSHGLSTSEYLDATCCWRAGSYLTLLEMTRAGLGWTTLPRQLILAELARGELVELDLTAYPHTDWQVGIDLVWKKAEPLGIAAAWLKQRLEQQAIFEDNNY